MIRVCSLVFFALGCCVFAQQDGPIITTKTGKVQGYLIEFESGIEVYEFSGIPFAKPPTGPLRFKKTVPIEPWSNIFDATKSPNTCAQLSEKYTVPTLRAGSSEDCLVLTIWVPRAHLDAVLSSSTTATDNLLSTYIYIHGGSFTGGSISSHNASAIAAYNNIITSDLQYRLGSLGFGYLGVDDAPGNMGLWDQLEGMKWIYNNIGAFGGNNSEITLAGESAGAASVTCHLLSPYSRPYFQRAIVESGSAFSSWAVRSPEAAMKASSIAFQSIVSKVCNQTQKSSVAEKIQCLRAAPAGAFPMADLAPMFAGFGIPFSPIVDGDFIPKDPMEIFKAGNYSKVPLLIGANKDEGSYFAAVNPEAAKLFPSMSNPNKSVDNLNMTNLHLLLEVGFKTLAGLDPLSVNPLVLNAVELEYWIPRNGKPKGSEIVQALSDATGDTSLLCPTYLWAEKTAAAVTDVYVYYFTHRRLGHTGPEWMGVMHTDELPFVFGHPLFPTTEEQGYTADDKLLSKIMMRYWTNFIKYGNPNGNQNGEAMDQVLRNWPPFQGESCTKQYFEINVPLVEDPTVGNAVICELKERDCTFWDNFIPKLVGTIAKTLTTPAPKQ